MKRVTRSVIRQCLDTAITLTNQTQRLEVDLSPVADEEQGLLIVSSVALRFALEFLAMAAGNMSRFLDNS